jgi:hypothetical protein
MLVVFWVGIRDDYEAKQNGLSHFAGVLAAFRYMGDITQDEEHAWYRKMLVALGYELSLILWVPSISSVVLTRTSLYLVATATIWEIEANSVGNGSGRVVVHPGEDGFVGSPPPPGGPDKTESVTSTQLDVRPGFLVGMCSCSPNIRVTAIWGSSDRSVGALTTP